MTTPTDKHREWATRFFTLFRKTLPPHNPRNVGKTALIDAAAQHLAEFEAELTGWKPIDDDAKDGRDILAYFPLKGLGDDRCRVVPVHWDNIYERWDFASRAASGFSRQYLPTHYQEITLPSQPEKEGSR